MIIINDKKRIKLSAADWLSEKRVINKNEFFWFPYWNWVVSFCLACHTNCALTYFKQLFVLISRCINWLHFSTPLLSFLSTIFLLWNAACELQLKNKLTSSIHRCVTISQLKLIVFIQMKCWILLIESDTCKLILPYSRFRCDESDISNPWLTNNAHTQRIHLFSFKWPICWQQTSANNDFK